MLAPQTECFTNIVQDFLVCTTIHKARQLGIFQSGIYVRLTLGKMTRRTKTHENSENPYFNEYFVFEIKCTLMELLRMTILYEIKKPTTCKKDATLGELLIDIQSVWNQSNRCYFKKWGRLEAPLGHIATFESAEGASGGSGAGGFGKGFLQIDLAIVSQASNPNTLLRPYEEDILVLNKWHLNQDYDDIEKNLLQNIDTGVRCNIRYTVTFYRGSMSKKEDYLLQGKTNVAKNTQEPIWNQEISFVWSYPSLAQTFSIQLLIHEHLQWKCVAEYEVYFNEIAFKETIDRWFDPWFMSRLNELGTNFYEMSQQLYMFVGLKANQNNKQFGKQQARYQPSLGPTFVNLYDNINGSQYIGRLLLSIKSECLDVESNHVVTLKQVTPLEEKRFWQEENFLIEFSPLQGDFIHASASSCKLTIKLAEQNSNFIECTLKNYPTALKKSQQHPIKIFKYFIQTSPFKSIALKITLPDNRKKFQIDIFIQEIMEFVKGETELFKLFQIQYSGHYQSQLKVLKVILSAIILRMEQAIEDNQFEYTNYKEATLWDINRLVYFKDYFHKVLDDLRSLRSKLRSSSNTYAEFLIDGAVSELIKYCNEFQLLLSISLLQDAWPDLILVLSVGSKEIGFCRLSAKNFMYPSKERDALYTSQCWKISNFIFKDKKCQHTCMNCGCIVAIIRGCLSIVTETQTSGFLSQIVEHWKHPEPFHWSPLIPYVNFKCRLFIHQGKIRPGADRNGLCDPYVRVMICNCAAETTVLFTTLSPIWNTVISFDNIRLPGDFLWYLNNPPLVALEVYDTDRQTADDYLGCGVLEISVIKSNWVEWYARENESWESNEVKNKHAIQKYELLKYLTPPPLKWIPIALNGAIRAEVLVSGELVESPIEIDEASESETCKTSVTVGIPNAIKPNMKNFVLEVVFAGFRNYRKRNFLTTKHRVKVMIADLILTSGLTTSPMKNSINFLILYASGVVSLPEQLEYWPAIIATDVAVSSKAQETTLGATLVANSKRYLQKEKSINCFSAEDDTEIDSVSTTMQVENESENEHETSDVQPLLHTKPRESYWQKLVKKFTFSKSEKSTLPEVDNLNEILDENDYNWWTKFYNSGFIDPCGALSDLKHKLCIYQDELEKQAEFSYLNDWADGFNMIHGIKYKKNLLPREEVYATLKLDLKITPCTCGHPTADGNGGMLRPLATALNPRYQAQLQSLAELVKITVRVYIVQGIQFRPSVKNIQADSYVKIQLGHKLVTNRADYIPHESNPIFGKCFQLEGLLPSENHKIFTIFQKLVRVLTNNEF